METCDLFSTRIFKTKIDKDSYDKKKIIEDCVSRYNPETQQNFWDEDSELHHYYGNLNNLPDLSSLTNIYSNIIEVYMSSINGDFQYRWDISNLAVNTKYMAEHDHFYRRENAQCVFSCIHYLSFDSENHTSTRFLNPLRFSMFPDNMISIKNKLSEDITTTAYSTDFTLDTEEDDFIIFPSYLKHSVIKGTKSSKNKPRIITSINIEWMI